MALNSEDDYNPFAAPESDLAPEIYIDTTGKFVYAGFGARLGALIVDGIVTQICMFLVGLVVGFSIVAGGQGDQRTIATMQAGLNLLSIVFVWLYYALQESSDAQATIGKRVMGIRVLDLSGQQLSFGRATGRHFGKLISGLLLGIGYFIQPFTERKQALHDIMAGAIVVKGHSTVRTSRELIEV